jgi:hypothetical protein
MPSVLLLLVGAASFASVGAWVMAELGVLGAVAAIAVTAAFIG